MHEWRDAARRGTFLEQCGAQLEAGVVQRQKLACWLRWRAKYGLILRHRHLLGQAAQQLRQRGLAAAFRWADSAGSTQAVARSCCDMMQHAVPTAAGAGGGAAAATLGPDLALLAPSCGDCPLL